MPQSVLRERKQQGIRRENGRAFQSCSGAQEAINPRRRSSSRPCGHQAPGQDHRQLDGPRPTTGAYFAPRAVSAVGLWAQVSAERDVLSNHAGPFDDAVAIAAEGSEQMMALGHCAARQLG